MKIRIVLCEGTHDIAFLSKILYANNYSNYNKNISEYPFPINNLFEQNFISENISDKRLGMKADSVLIPSATMQKENDLVFFHNMNGDATTSYRYTVIDQYNELKELESLGIYDSDFGFEFEYLLFYDADDLGVGGRINFIKDNFCDRFSIDRSEIGQAKKNHSGNTILGSYIFYDSEDLNKKGTLEDQLIKLMKKSNETIFEASDDYIQTNKLEEERTKFYFPNTDCYSGKKKFKIKKSLISICGQLQFSGSDNAVIISKSDYISKQDILDDDQCCEIMKLFS